MHQNQHPSQPDDQAIPAADHPAPKITRRAALRTWVTYTAPLVLLSACAAPASIITGSASGLPRATRDASTTAWGAGGIAVQQSLPSCILAPRQTEGPYFVDEQVNRSDIRSDTRDGSVREGIPLNLTLQITQVSGSACAPLAGVYVDLWHCDAQGIYSDVKDNTWGSTVGSTFLRGYQITDEQGQVQFTTIYPGWYQGRTVHIHFKIRTALDARTGREQISQLYFDDALTDQVHAQPPYAAKGQRTMRNNQDGIYRGGGSQLTVPVIQDGDGYAGTFNIGVQLT